MGRLVCAGALLATCQGTPPPAPPPPADAQTLYEQGLKLRAEGRRREAAEAWEAGLRADPQHVDTQVALAGTLITLREYARASALLETALAARPDDAAVWLEQGRLHFGLHEYEDAVDSFGEALELDPVLASARIGRLEAFVGLGRCDEARLELRALRERQRFRYARAERLVRSCEPPVE